MDKDRILRLCNEIEDIATEIQEGTMKKQLFYGTNNHKQSSCNRHRDQ